MQQQTGEMEKETVKDTPQSPDEHITYEVMSTVHIDNEKWQETIEVLKEKAFFFKWLGPWPFVKTIRLGCKAIWGKDCRLKTLTNGFYMGLAPSKSNK